MKVLIIEDEKPAARLLQRKLEKLGMEIFAMLHSVEEAIVWFSRNEHPDLIFLDIQLSDGLSFEIFETIDIQSAVIFTTAYDEYALKAFKLNSIDYLLKPIDEDDLQAALAKFKSRTKGTASQIDLSDIRTLLGSQFGKTYKRRFTAKVGQQLKVIAAEEIECFFSENKGTYIHTKDNRDYLIDAPLEQVEAEIDPSEFFRISRKFIVPLAAVREILMYSNSRLRVMLPTYKADDVIVSREKVAEFKKWIER